jgi:GTPase SAR1 family protein
VSLKINGMHSLFEDSIRCIEGLGPKFIVSRKKLEELEKRLQEGRFNLAVLGQFKRGKSTFLNALLGDELLPSSVLPLTAIPTLIQFGNSLLVRALNHDGTVKEEILGKRHEEIAAFLAKYVTEESNPNNRLGIAHVEVFYQAPILGKGVVLIDTPGIGSTYRHNTEATLAFLPQCDAAMFLISADPPISEVELDFLKKVRSRVPKLFFILNKVDYLSEEEKQASVQFFKKILREQGGIEGDAPLFCVSARRGMNAKVARDEDGWIASGMAEVKDHLIEFLVKDKNDTLQSALSRKAEDILSDILMQVHLAVRTLQMPLEELEERRRVFEEKINDAEHQRVVAGDMLRGDRKRSLEFLENQSIQLRRKARTYLEDIVESVLKDQPDMNAARKTLSDTIPTFFEEELFEMAKIFDAHVHQTLNPHQKSADKLIETIRKAAAELFEIPYHAPKSSDAFEMTREPYWVTSERRNFFNPIPENLVLRMLPPGVRRLRIRKRLHEDIESLVTQNVENLRWATLQNLDRAFRNFSALLDERMSNTIKATHGAIQAACAKRREQSDAVAEELARLADAGNKLEGIIKEFQEK